jgi:hypothetical protein
VLGEFFAASPESVGLSAADGPSAGEQTVAAKGLSEVSLATLGEILGAGTYDDLLDVIGDGIDAESGEAGVLPIPDKMRDALARLDSVEQISAAWANTEELAADGWSAEASAVVLRVGALAQEAGASGLGLYYWWSL